MKRQQNKRIAQCIIEYVGVALCFTLAGVLFFSVASKQYLESYRSNKAINTILGTNDGDQWPSGWAPDQQIVERELYDVGLGQGLGE